MILHRIMSVSLQTVHRLLCGADPSLTDSTASVKRVRPCLSHQAHPRRAAVQSLRSCQGKAAAMGKAPMNA